MTSELRDQLQATLNGSYTLERELGGGGMSRVFLADELRLDRKVVVKVLSPELAAGLSAERFEREIKLAASLQQANIVPVLAAGDTNGLPYYTMPFVDGESLRHRLNSGPLGVNETVGILRDVARALAYAHERGVVHRDIKPDNVLLSGATAVVTDFGIAKALAASRRGASSAEERGTALTVMGTSIGTPAYMSPEQAAGDPDVDHRADIYAFACMAYELLAGEPPFHGRTPQRTLAAHMAEAPRPITELRADTPAPLADLIMRALEKDPASRPQTASEVAQALDAVTSGIGAPPVTPIENGRLFRRALVIYAASFVAVAIIARAAVIAIGVPDWVFPGAMAVMATGLPVILLTGFAQRANDRALTAARGGRTGQGTLATIAMKASPLLSWRRTAQGGLYALGAFVAAVLGIMVLRGFGIGPAGSLLAAGKLNRSEPLLVADFKTTAADSALSGVLAEALRTNLGESRVISVVPASTITAALQRMRKPPDSKLELALARDLAQREGVKGVVSGELTPLSSGYVVTARLVAAASGDELASFQETADGAKDLIGTVDRLARKLRGRIGESLKSVRGDPPLEQVSTGSLEALRKYAEGSRANDIEGDYIKATRLLEEAVALDTSFGMAYRKLAQAINNSGVRTDRRAPALQRAYDRRYRMTERERLITTASYYDGGPFPDRRRAIEAYETLLQRYPEAGWYQNLGNVLMSMREFARADSSYERAIGASGIGSGSGSAFQYFNIVNAKLSRGNIVGARAALEAAAARFPGDLRIDAQGGEIVYAEGRLDSVDAIARRLAGSRLVRGQITGENALGNLSLLRGRVNAAWQHAAKARALNESRGQPSIPLLDSITSAQLQVLFYNRPAESVKKLDAALVKTPMSSMAPQSRPYLTAAIAYGVAGRADRARALVDQNDAEATDSVARRLEAPARHVALGWIDLASGKPQDAVAEFRQGDMRFDGPVNACPICADVGIGIAFDRANMPDSTIAVYEHYVNTPYSGRLGQDAFMLPGIAKRLGELYEVKGDRVRAAAYYTKFVELWKNADPDLQPQVAEVRKRLARISDPENPRP